METSSPPALCSCDLSGSRLAPTTRMVLHPRQRVDPTLARGGAMSSREQACRRAAVRAARRGPLGGPPGDGVVIVCSLAPRAGNSNLVGVRSVHRSSRSPSPIPRRRRPNRSFRPSAVLRRADVTGCIAAVAAGGLRRPCSRSRPPCSRSARWWRRSSKDRSRGRCRPSSQLRPATPRRGLLSDPRNCRCRP